MFKFRGIDKTNGNEVVGYLTHPITGGVSIDVVVNCGDFNATFSPLVFPDSLAISFGKTDKNGKEIFASFPVDGKMSRGGDRVKLDQWHPEEYKIVFYETAFYMRSDFGNLIEIDIIDNQIDCEIISTQQENKLWI